MRSQFVFIHRWAGLFIAVFLFIAGLTGAIISWDHEVDEWLNPHLFEAPSAGTPLPPLELAAMVEAADPRSRVTWVPLSFEQGHNAAIGVEPKVDSKTGELYPLDYNQAFVNPASGQIVGKRYWGRISLSSEDILPFLYKLHYSMHIPTFANIDRWGMWFMGIVGIVWLFDCFVGFYLTLPTRVRRGVSLGAAAVSDAVLDDSSLPTGRRSWWQRWKPAWQIKFGASAFRFNLDIHRAFGLWLWAMLFIIAFTSMSMNLGNEIVRPILNTVSSLTPDAFDDRTPTALNKPIVPNVGFAAAIETAKAEALERGWTEPAGGAYYGQQYGIYAVQFYAPGDEHGSGGLGNKMMFIDGTNGSLAGGRVPWEGTAADVFMQLQFPLHSGRIAGLPGRILLSVMGLTVAMLSATGIYIWFKKRRARMTSSWRLRSDGSPLRNGGMGAEAP